MQPVSVRDGFILPDSNYFLTLFTAAQAYLALGYSVIPLHGDVDPIRPKVAATPWRDYQHTRPTEEQLNQWFTVEHFGALGIVTGQISRLVVLDFDDPRLFHRFGKQYPDLAERHVIQTRRGCHIYYQLPQHLRVATRKGQGIDLLSDGCYVVARPSIIDGHTYKLIRGGQPKRLTLGDIGRIKDFLENQAPPPPVAPSTPKRELTPFSHDCGLLGMSPPSFTHLLSRLETCLQPISVMSIRSDATRPCSGPAYERGMRAGAGKIP